MHPVCHMETVRHAQVRPWKGNVLLWNMTTQTIEINLQIKHDCYSLFHQKPAHASSIDGMYLKDKKTRTLAHSYRLVDSNTCDPIEIH